MEDPYEVLGAYRGMPDDELRRRYRELVRANHPDRFVQGSEEQITASRRLPEINAAYQLLSDPQALARHERLAPVRAARRKAAQDAARADGRSAGPTVRDPGPSPAPPPRAARPDAATHDDGPARDEEDGRPGLLSRLRRRRAR